MFYTHHMNPERCLISPLSLADRLVKTVDSVFVFQEGVESDTNAAAAYDAIVVEQWTIVDVSYTQIHCVLQSTIIIFNCTL